MAPLVSNIQLTPTAPERMSQVEAECELLSRYLNDLAAAVVGLESRLKPVLLPLIEEAHQNEGSPIQELVSLAKGLDDANILLLDMVRILIGIQKRLEL